MTCGPVNARDSLRIVPCLPITFAEIDQEEIRAFKFLADTEPHQHSAEDNRATTDEAHHCKEWGEHEILNYESNKFV